MSISNSKWESLDNETETTTVNNIVFIRPKKSVTLSISCKECNLLISSIEDCESLQENDVCFDCYTNKSFTKKDNIYN